MISHFPSAVPPTVLPRMATLARPAQQTAFLSSYPPRQCGIATFTRDLKTALDATTQRPGLVVAMNDTAERYAYGAEVTLQIERNDPASYIRAARSLAQMPIDLINVQHEYGLFGGDWGSYLIALYDHAKQPITTTLHSVIPNPEPGLRQVTRALAERSAKVVVLAEAATAILTRDYGIARAKLQVIPHGIPTITNPARAHAIAKSALGYDGRTVLSTFGLMSPNKGVEFALHSLPQIVNAHPEVLYLIIGQTHPGVRAHEGEAYRTRLQDLVRELNLERNVAFVDRYLTLPQLMQYVLATDVYVLPYLNPTQIVSGTLAYAMGSGRAVVSTPFLHAREVLANGKGVLVPFRDSIAMTRAINGLLENANVRQEIERRAYAASRAWIWPAVAAQYQTVYKEAAQHALSALAF